MRARIKRKIKRKFKNYLKKHGWDKVTEWCEARNTDHANYRQFSQFVNQHKNGR